MRQGEVLGLRWGDIDLDAQVIRVEQTLVNLGKSGGLVFGTPKSATSRRTIPLTPLIEARVRLALAHIDGNPDPAALVFARADGRPVHPATDLRAWRELLDAHDLSSVTLHAARNTASNLMEAAGIPDRMAAQILGHSSVQITHGYQNAEVERMRAGLNGIERLLGAPKELGD
jgi:integrase